MADNVILDAGSGGDTIRTIDRTGIETAASVIDVGGSTGAEAIIGDAGVFMPTEGAAAENAAAAGNPVLVGARYDATPRTLGDGDVGAIALDADGAVHISDGGNTITIDGTVTANAGTGTFTVYGDLAHDAIDTGSNPIKIGAKIETATSGIATLPADGDRTDLYADQDGTLQVRVNHPLADLLHNRVSDTAGTSANFTGDFAAAGTGVKNYVTAITLHNSSATDGYVDFRDGSAGSVLWTVPIPAGGGAVISNGGHPLFGTSANTALAYDVSAALSTVYVSVSGFKSKV